MYWQINHHPRRNDIVQQVFYAPFKNPVRISGKADEHILHLVPKYLHPHKPERQTPHQKRKSRNDHRSGHSEEQKQKDCPYAEAGKADHNQPISHISDCRSPCGGGHHSKQYVLGQNQISIQLTVYDQFGQGKYSCEQDVGQSKAAGGKPPQHHNLPKPISANVLFQAEQNCPLNQKGTVVQHHKNDIGEEGNLINHLPHDIILHGKQAHPQLIVHRRSAHSVLPAFFSLH